MTLPRDPAPRGGGSTAPRAWWRVPWYPVAVPLAFILLVWADSLLPAVWLIRPVVVVVAFSLGLTAVLSAVVRDRNRAALAAWAIVVALVVRELAASALLALVAVFVVGEGIVHRGTPWRFGARISSALSVLSVLLVAVTVVSGLSGGAVSTAVDEVADDLARTARADTFNPATPDIYVILLDGYPGDDALASLAPGFDRNAFPNQLTSRGFSVERGSRSNYLLTRLTLPSMFNGQQLGDVHALNGVVGAGDPWDSVVLREATDEGAVWKAVGDAGMDRIAISSGWAQLGLRRVERVIDPPQLTEFEFTLLRGSGLGELVTDVAPQMGPAQTADRIKTALTSARDLAAEDHTRPRFVFVHVPAPHEPWVFTDDGGLNLDTPGGYLDKFGGGEKLTRDEKIARLTGHITYLDKLVVDAVDGILAAAKRPTAIVLFSDHGSDVGFDPNNALGSDLNERTSNILAVRTPGKTDVLPAGTTLVNVLPRVLNAYLGTSLPIQPDTTWAWRGKSVLSFVQIQRDAASGTWAAVTPVGAAGGAAP